MKEILILTDDDRFFARSYKKPENMDVDALMALFAEKGYRVLATTVTQINWHASYNGTIVLYPYSKLAGLFYKGFIEDALIRLQYRGAHLLPDFRHFRAYQNKVFMEFLRQDFKCGELKTIHSICFGSMQGVLDYPADKLQFPLVLKISVGTKGRGVFKVDKMEHLIEAVNKVTPILMSDFQSSFNETSPLSLGGKRINYSEVHHKFILQPFIANLSGDYKVAIFGEKYYVYFRRSRENDFRSSSGGSYSLPLLDGELIKILDFAKLAFEEIGAPTLSVDIGFDGRICHLIEFQCMSFSPNIERITKGWYTNDGEWYFHEGRSSIEEDYTAAIDCFLNKGGAVSC